jgi:hypothetical protein
MKRMWMLLAVAALAACSQDSGTGGPSGPTTPGTGSGPSTSAVTAVKSASIVNTSTLPAEITPSAVASAGGVDVVVGETWFPPDQTAPASALAAVRKDQGAWQLVTIDDGAGYAPPATASDPVYGWGAGDVAAGPGGFVAVGSASFYSGNVASGLGSLIWFSADGLSWTRIDVRTVVPSVDPTGVQLTAVAATSAGYVVLGRNGMQQTLLLSSADGQNWSLAATTALRWAIVPKGLFADGDRVVAWYDEFECLGEPLASGSQPVLFASQNGGSSWGAVNMATVPELSKYVPEADTAACAASGTGFDALAAAYHGSFGAIGVAGGKFTTANAGFTSIATSADMVNWTTVDIPAPRPNTTNLAGYSVGNNFRVAAFGSDTALLTASSPSTPTGQMSLMGWASADGGATWVAVAGAEAGTATSHVAFSSQPDGRLFVLMQPRDTQFHVTAAATMIELTLQTA